MRVELNSVSKSNKSINQGSSYFIVGVICGLKSSYIDKPNLVRNSEELSIFVDQDSDEFNELNSLVNSGYVLDLSNRFIDKSEFHSYLTPINDKLTLPVPQVSNLTGVTLSDPSEFTDQTYVIKFTYDPTESSDGFYLCLPTNFIESDSEFMTSINVYIQGQLPEWVDDETEVFNIEVTGSNLGEVFSDLADKINNPSSSMNSYLTSYLAKEVTNSNGEFVICYKSPVRYVYKSEFHSSITPHFDYSDNIEFLSEYVPDGTITFESRLLGDCSELNISYLDGLLKLNLGNLTEEFEVDGNSDSGKFIGDIQSELVNVKVNTQIRTSVVIPEFSSSFKPISYSIDSIYDIQSSIKSFTESELNINFIVLSDSLIEYNLDQIDLSSLDKSLLITHSNSIQKLSREFNNTLRFSGSVDGIPSYTKFLDSVYKCDFSSSIDGVPEYPSELDSNDIGVFHPISPEFYTELKLGWIPDLNVDLGYDLNKINIYQLVFVYALSNFILRYKYKLLHVISPLGSLKSLISEFQVKYPIYKSISIKSYRSEFNSIYVELDTYLNSLTNSESIKLNFNLKI